MSLNEQQQKDIKVLENHLEVIQKFVDENIVQKNKAMPSALIFNELSSSLPNIEEAVFKRSFSLNVKEGNIKGIVGAKRAGFKPINEAEEEVNDTLPAPPPITVEVEDEEKTCLSINETLRLCGVDKRNWSLQKVQNTAGGRVWVSQNYWPTLDSALKGIATSLLNKEIKGSKLSTADLKDVVKCIQEAENRIYEKLITALNESKQEIPSVSEFEDVA